MCVTLMMIDVCTQLISSRRCYVEADCTDIALYITLTHT